MFQDAEFTTLFDSFDSFEQMVIKMQYKDLLAAARKKNRGQNNGPEMEEVMTKVLQMAAMFETIIERHNRLNESK